MNQEKLFFSIVIPAHNEEKYIEETLTNIKNLNYPADSLETIVVENGSTDKTAEIAKKFESQNIKVFISTEKGVSKARNFGISKVNLKSDWVIFLDADTILKSDFLNELNTYLQKNINKNLSVGTVSLRPLPETLVAKFWFSFFDLSYRFFKLSFAIQIARASLLKNIKYDEQMEKAEDQKFIKDLRRFGNFFFMHTRSVFTSTRRFTQVGWLKLLGIWSLETISASWRQRHLKYPVIR